MSIKSALAFIERVRYEAEFRREACEAPPDGDFAVWLEASGYDFSMAESQDAFRSLLLKCRDEEAAEEVRELRLWFSLLARAEEEPSAACGSCVKRNSCGGSCE